MPKGMPLRVLIVDDNEDMCWSLADILNEFHFETLIANDGENALDVAKENKIDIALIDIKMPGINGAETCAQLKRIDATIKIYMMTAYSSDDLIDKALGNGATRVFNKPVNVKELISIMEQTTVDS